MSLAVIVLTLFWW